MTTATAPEKACCCATPAKTPMAATFGEKTQTHDPVCGMSVDPATAKHRADVQGQTYYFCCGGCKAKFVANPDQSLKAASAPGSPAAPSPPVAQGTIYTCPM
ncbi:MAG: YHS domain-containing protein, partial [Bryobacteraceae bacterium]